MIPRLPSDLLEVEGEILESIIIALKSKSLGSRLSINIIFDGLRLNPILYRLAKNLSDSIISCIGIVVEVGTTL